MIHKNLFSETNQDSTISFTWENSKVFNITSKYFSIFNNKPPASWGAHITRDFVTCYSCSYCNFMSHQTFKLFDLNEDFPKLTQQASYHFWFRKDCVTSFSCSFLCFQIYAEITKIKERTKRNLYFTYNALLWYFNVLV